jgi:hypothetical protein
VILEEEGRVREDPCLLPRGEDLYLEKETGRFEKEAG